MKMPQHSLPDPLWSLFGIGLLILGWSTAADQLGSLVMASPSEAGLALWQLLHQPNAVQQLLTSGQRILVGIFAGTLLGFSLGICAGLARPVRFLLEPLRWLLMSVPPVILVVLAMLWFGMGSAMVMFMVVVLLAPGIYVNTVKGIRMVDPQLLEMARVYQLRPWQRLTRLYIPAISAPLTAALLIALCNGVRIVVLAELLGGENGMGHAIANARSSFDSATLYGWVLLILLLVAVLELLLLQPVQRRLNRWQPEKTHAAT